MTLTLSKISLRNYVQCTFAARASTVDVSAIKPGDVVRVSAKDLLRASKGDTIAVASGGWIILAGLSFDKVVEVLTKNLADARCVKSIEVAAEIIKCVPERRFCLAKPLELRVAADYQRLYTVSEDLETETKVVDGVEFVIGKMRVQRYQEYGTKIVDVLRSRVEHQLLERQRLSEGIEHGVRWRIVDPRTRLARTVELMQRVAGDTLSWGYAYIFTDGYAINVRAWRSVEVSAAEIPNVPEDLLARASRFYTVAVPRIAVSCRAPLGEGKYAPISFAVSELWYRGMRRTIVLNSPSIPKSLAFSVRRQKLLSSYARKVLPRGFDGIELDPYTSIERVTDAAKRFANAVDIAASYAERRFGYRSSDPIEMLFDAIYITTPRRKLRLVKEWVELFDKVKDLAPSASLYIVFYGQIIYKRRKPRFVGFRIDKDGSVSLLSRRTVPVSGIVMKGGEFEDAYREAYNLDRLVWWHYAPRKVKLEELWRDIEAVRRLLEERGISRDISIQKLVEELTKLGLEASEQCSDNIALNFFAFRARAKHDEIGVEWRQRVDATALTLAGLVKTGRESEVERLDLDVVVASNLWTMKFRGYSPRLGVLMLGDPATVRARIAEVVQRLSGRIAALATIMDLLRSTEVGGTMELELETRLEQVLH